MCRWRAGGFAPSQTEPGSNWVCRYRAPVQRCAGLSRLWRCGAELRGNARARSVRKVQPGAEPQVVRGGSGPSNGPRMSSHRVTFGEPDHETRTPAFAVEIRALVRQRAGASCICARGRDLWPFKGQGTASERASKGQRIPSGCLMVDLPANNRQLKSRQRAELTATLPRLSLASSATVLAIQQAR